MRSFISKKARSWTGFSLLSFQEIDMNMTRFKSAAVRRVLAISAGALLGSSVWAQTDSASAPPPPPPVHGQAAGPHGGAPRHHAGNWGEQIQQRLAELKSQLGLSPAQEVAWTQWTEAGKAEEFGTPPDPQAERQALEKLTTPERIDRLRALRAQRDLQQRQREEATKVFYAQLSAQQKQVFDRETLRGPGPGPAHHGKGPGQPGSEPPPPPPPAAPAQ
jgi:protein CpxP